jgi:Cu-Zn family superoxide dismutase
MRALIHRLTCGLGLLALTACHQSDHKAAAEEEGISARRAMAILAPLHDSRAVGMVTFTATDKGVKVVADVEGLSPGAHGFHIHEFGVCVGDGTSAGGHYNPDESPHGAPENPKRHAGDLGNLIANDQGYAHYERIDSKITLQGSKSIVGHSVIIHEKADDYVTQPTGNSGGRMSCGLIEKVE